MRACDVIIVRRAVVDVRSVDNDDEDDDGDEEEDDDIFA